MKNYYTLSISLLKLFLFSFIFLITSAYPISKSHMKGIIRHDTDIEQYRAIGRLPEFSCAGRYSISERSQDYAVGVLVAPNWVLTAAHFVEDSSFWMFGENYYKSRRIIKYPKLKLRKEERAAQWDGWDMALVELESSVSDIKPAVRYRGTSEFGATITKVGYGIVGDGLSGMKSPTVQERLGGNNIIDAIGGVINEIILGEDVLVCDFDSPDSDAFNQLGSPIPLEMEIGGSKGDSGGGIFIENNGVWQLAGIVSGGLNKEIKYGSMIAIARVSSANTWIDSVITRFNEK